MGDDNICNDAAYQNMILQRRRFQLLNIPPVRYDNLANNPYKLTYPGTLQKFTKIDLDMRRKVEILKYSANNSSTQTNRFTKAEIYAQAISGKYQQRTYPNSFVRDNSINNQLNICPTIKTPTSACGVPGPIIYLYEDNDVPLYNFITNIAGNYGTLTQGVNPYEKTWDYTTNEKNKIAIDSFGTTITSIFILYQDIPTKIFSIQIPIGLSFNGKTSATASNIGTTITIQSTFTNNMFPTSPYYNIDQVSQQNIIYSFTSRQIIITLNERGGSNIDSMNFSGICYLGMLTISNIILPIQKGFIYDIKSYCNKTFFDSTGESIDTFVFNIIFGFSYSSIPTPTNCSIAGNNTSLPTTHVVVTDV
jgi:hypothetical protein